MNVDDNSPNVLLIIMDGVRAMNTSIHNYRNQTTVFLDEFQEKACTYHQCRAPGTKSISSHTSMFTGLNVRQHGITGRYDKLSAGHTIWEDLFSSGYDTAVFSNNPFLTELPVGLKDSFGQIIGREVENPFPDAINPKNFVIDAPDSGLKKYMRFLGKSLSNGNLMKSICNGLSFKVDTDKNIYPEVIKADDSADVYADLLLNWISNRDKPWAACINFMDAHFPYSPDYKNNVWGSSRIRTIQKEMVGQSWAYISGSSPWGERRAIKSLYDGAIRQIDTAIEKVVTGIKNTNQFSNTLIVITSDHGEGFGEVSYVHPENRIVGHGNGGVHECLTHVPLLVKYPYQTTPKSTNQVTSLINFPMAVRDTIQNEGGIDSFLSDDPVICSTLGIDSDTAERARNYCDDITPYSKNADAVYTGGSPIIEKQAQWGCRQKKIKIRDAHTRWIESDDAPHVDDIKKKLKDNRVKIEANEDISSDLSDRLENLGYK